MSSAKGTEKEAKKYVNDMIEKLSQDDEDEEKPEELAEGETKKEPPVEIEKPMSPKSDGPAKDNKKEEAPKEAEKDEEPSKDAEAPKETDAPKEADAPKEDEPKNDDEPKKEDEAPKQDEAAKEDDALPKKAATVTVDEANTYHEFPIPGKYQTIPCKPLLTEHDLRLAYAPGVAFPCQEIADDPSKVYEFTAKSNSVCVISNGTAVLGLGNIGAAASKPVMEGKGCLMKKFGDVNGVDLEVNTTDKEEFINCVKLIGSSYGGINLEDIKGPDCFYIENTLKEIMDIPVFHDDQHGTAIIVAAGLINACHLRQKELSKIKVVFNGAGAAGIACLQMVIDSGVDKVKFLNILGYFC